MTTAADPALLLRSLAAALPHAELANTVPSVHVESTVVIASGGAVPREAAAIVVFHQAALPAPAKLALSGNGAAYLLAEVARVEDLSACVDRVLDAFELGVAPLLRAAPWGDSSPAGGSHAEQYSAADDVELTQGLDALPWSWQANDDGSLRVFAEVRDGARAQAAHVRVERLSGTGVLRAAASLTLRLHAPHTRDALARFALEANARLRLARLSLADGSEGDGAAARWICDAVVPTGAPTARAAVAAIEAVAFARVATGRSATALTDPDVAAGFLSLRGAIPDDDNNPNIQGKEKTWS